TVAQVVNVVHLAAAVFQVDKLFDHRENVFFGQRAVIHRRLFKRNVEAMIDLETTDLREIVSLRIEEQAMEESFSSVSRWRLTRTEAFIDFDQSLFTRVDLVDQQCIAQERPNSHSIKENHVEFVDTCIE